MILRALSSVLLLAIVLPSHSLSQESLSQEKQLSFTRDIRPILSDNCFSCHGPDDNRREGGFRLDERDSALAPADSGEAPIVPGQWDASELIARITTSDADLRMPPAESNKSLSPAQIEQLKTWIAQGAPYAQHWSFVPPQAPELPEVADRSWVKNPIDQFVLAALEQESWKPSERAAKEILLRRVTLDLTGLPPTTEELDSYLADSSENAFEKVVDRLLDSPAYGEQMARYWLDAARYGDTHGLHLDNYREMWPYRDWVVDAFNRNLPYRDFVIEQLAGDLLPDASVEQLVATGFNRCHVTTNEGGSIKEEVYVRNVVDRVVTFGTVFLGLTLECTRCHDHKYDPLTMRDFYSLFAYFNSIDGDAMDGNRKDPAPIVRVASEAQQGKLAAFDERLASLNQALQEHYAQVQYTEPPAGSEVLQPQPVENVWIDDAVPSGADPQGGWTFVTDPVFSGSKASTRTAQGLSQHFFQNAKDPQVIQAGDVLFCYVYLDPENPPKQIMLQWNDGSWDHRAYWGSNEIDWGKDQSPSRLRKGDLPSLGEWVRLEVTAAEVGLKPGAKVSGWAFTQFDGTTYWDRAGIRSEPQPQYRSLAKWVESVSGKADGLPKPLQTILSKDADQRSSAELAQLKRHFIENVCVDTRGPFLKLREQLQTTRAEKQSFENSLPTTLVFREREKPRQAYMLNRGEYDQRGDEVSRRVPELFRPTGKTPANRLELAEWLVQDDHPLTSRVAVNRIWLQFFGTGIVKTAEDFGSQGEVPSHPELLDWLATSYIQSGWDTKWLVKQIVMSATYQQSSRVQPQQYQLDPQNRKLARGPRFRLDAEALRDQALALSGLLVPQLGGPSVKPPQPDGLWFAVGYSGSNTVRFKADTGPEKVQRRTLYTFIKRTAPPPQMSTFDAPSRESCVVRRERTNTPLQALLLLNDPQYFQAAAALARRMMHEAPQEPKQRLSWGFRLCTARHPDPNELQELQQLLADQQQFYREHPDEAKKLVTAYSVEPVDESDYSELAAWTVLANTLLNLDEVVTKN